LLFVIAGGIGVGMCTFFYQKENFASFFVAGRHSWYDDLAYLQDATKRLGIKARVQETSGAKAAEKQLRDALADGAPCVAWVDMCSLPHRAMPEWMQGGGYHVVTVYKVDGDDVLIGDLTDETIRVDAGAFAAARARIKKQKNRLLSIAPSSNKVDLKKAVYDGLRTCAKSLVEAKYGPFTEHFRLGAFKMWAERLHGSNHKESWDKIFASPGNFWSALTSVHQYIESYGTGGGLCRPIFADGLAEAGAALKDAKLTALSKRYREIGQQWSALAEAALPAKVPLFEEARKLNTRRAELAHAGGPTDELRDVWQQLDALKKRAVEKFPLSDQQRRDLCAALQERVRKLYDAEVAAHKEMINLL
jgi:hypothetical protein